MKLIDLEMGFTAIVDDSDYERLKGYRYHLRGYCGKFYAFRKYRENGKDTNMSLHNDVLELPKLPGKLCIDHINGNSLDCRKSNLRVVTRSQNNQSCGPRRISSSKYKGVCYQSSEVHRRRPWRARITVDGEAISRYFEDEYSAVRCYNMMAVRHFGKFAYLNEWDGPTRKEDDE